MDDIRKRKYLDWLPIWFPQILEVHAVKCPVRDFLSPTEWGRAVRAIRRLEKALGELVHLEELAPIAHEILLAHGTLNPLAVVRVR